MEYVIGLRISSKISEFPIRFISAQVYRISTSVAYPSEGSWEVFLGGGAVAGG